MESHIEQLTNDLKSKIDLNGEFKVKNKVLEVGMEHLKEKLESTMSKNDKLIEEHECLKNKIENEKKLYTAKGRRPKIVLLRTRICKQISKRSRIER